MSLYRVVADPQERSIEAEEYDGVICTGDILDYAPPPNEDPAGSVLASLVDDARSLYEEEDVKEIFTTLQQLDSSEVREEAEQRYEEFFEDIDTDFYYVAGNLDVPGVLDDVASKYSYVGPVDALEGVCGVDGCVPDFAGLPEDVFPGEIEEDVFLEAVDEAEEDIVVMHAVPDEFDPASYGFDRAIASEGEQEQNIAGVDEVPSFPEGEAEEEYAIEVEM